MPKEKKVEYKDPPEEMILNSKQLKGLELLSKIDVDKAVSIKQLSWVGRFFYWLDINIFDKTTKLWLYLLETAGVVAIFIIIDDMQHGLSKIAASTNEFELKVAESYVSSVIQLAPAVAAMVATICGALPAIIGVMRSLKTKWKNGNEEKTDSIPSEDEIGKGC